MANDYQTQIKSISERIIFQNKINYSLLAEMMEESKEISKMFTNENFLQEFIDANPEIQQSIKPLKLMIDSYRAEGKLIQARNEFMKAVKLEANKSTEAANTYIETINAISAQTDIFMKVFGAIGIMNRPTELPVPKIFDSQKVLDVYSQLCQLFIDLPDDTDLQLQTRIFSIIKRMQIAYFDEHDQAIETSDTLLKDALCKRSYSLQTKLLQLIYDTMENNA